MGIYIKGMKLPKQGKVTIQKDWLDEPYKEPNMEE